MYHVIALPGISVFGPVATHSAAMALLRSRCDATGEDVSEFGIVHESCILTANTPTKETTPMFKYDLNQMIYYIMDNRIYSAPVISRMTVENVDNVTGSSPWGKNKTQYATCHGIIKEEEAFAAPRDVADALVRAAEKAAG